MAKNPTRRQILATAAAAASATPVSANPPPRILLRNSWGSANIGDVGHTPGALSLLAKYFPEAEITLWPGKLSDTAREVLTVNYPRLQIADGTLTDAGKPSTPALAKAWEQADFYLSGSGSGFPASDHAAAFHKVTGKPVGVFGVSTDPISGIGPGREAEGGTLNELRAKAARLPADHLPAVLRALIDRTSFFFCRDTISRDYLRAQGVKTPILDFGPDSQLGMHIRNDRKGLAYLASTGLQPGKFLCAIPRLRYTPYYKVNNTPRVATDDIRDAINERTVETDHAKLRAMIIAYVKATGNKVLACPEMTYQVEVAKQYLVDPLPADIKRNVVWRSTFWMPDEAASVYAKSQAVVSVECHSPLIALYNGTPGIYVRQPSDTCKGQMYRDFGAADWFFEVDETSGDQLWLRVESIVRDRKAAQAKVRSIMDQVVDRQKQMVAAVREATLAHRAG